jgi:hypothetical protein
MIGIEEGSVLGELSTPAYAAANSSNAISDAAASAPSIGEANTMPRLRPASRAEAVV